MDLNHQVSSAEASRPSEAELSQQVSEMKAELERYKVELEQLRQQVESPQQSIQAAPITSRRRVLRHMVAGAAGLGALSIAAVASSNQVQAETAGDNAIDAQGGGSGYGGKFTSNFAQLRLVPATTTLPSNFSSHNTGEFFVDPTGALYFSVNSGGTATSAPDRWRKIVGPSTAGTLHLLNPPARFVDTRSGTNNLNDTQGAYTHRSPRTYAMTTISGKGSVTLPSGAAGIVGNITVISGAQAGFLQISPTTPDANNDPSALNFGANTVTGNNFSVALSSSGAVTVQISFYSPVAGVTVDVIIDVTGYYY